MLSSKLNKLSNGLQNGCIKLNNGSRTVIGNRAKKMKEN